MGNLCGKQSKDDNFAGPGRTLGSAPPPSDNARASIPATKKSPLQGNGRTLGGPGGSGDDDPRSAAAKAAEVRSLSAYELFVMLICVLNRNAPLATRQKRPGTKSSPTAQRWQRPVMPSAEPGMRMKWRMREPGIERTAVNPVIYTPAAGMALDSPAILES